LATLLAALAFLLSPVNQAWGAPASEINQQELDARQDITGTITTPMMWTNERITNQKLFTNMGDHSLRLDSTGMAHLAYGGDHLYYASFDGTNWSVETIDASDNVGQYASLFIDSSDHPHISYYDAHNGNLKYARNLGGGWEAYTIAWHWQAQDGFVDLEAASQVQAPLEAYTSPRDWQSIPTGLETTVNPETFTTVVSDTMGVGLYTSVAVDANGNPYISYYDAINGDLKCIRLMLGQWYVDTVDADEVTGLYSSIAVDDSSPVKIYISYYDYTSKNLRYASWNGSKWSRFTADSAGNVGLYTSIALDNNDKAYISYYDATNKDLKYAHWTGSTFTIAKVDGTSVDVGEYSSIALKDGKNPHISYYDATHGNLRYAAYSGTAWEIFTLSTEELSGWYSSIALDPDHNYFPRVSFYSGVSGQLKFVQRTTGTNWQTSVIDQAHDQGAFVSMDLDSTGKPHVAFFDDVSDVLNYAVWDGSAWQVEVADSTPLVGMYCSLVMGPSDIPHISYWDARGRLRYAAKSGGTWYIEFADPAIGVGEYSSIALDSSGLPYISYYDATDKNLRLTHKRINGTWEVFVVDATDNVGLYTSLAIDTGDLPHISYYNATNKSLKYATLVGGVWQKNYISQVGNDVGKYTSLVLDSAENPHIAYFRDDNDSLMYAYFNGVSWTVQEVDSKGVVGFNPSLALDSSNNPHISYYAFGQTTDLKVARWTGSKWLVQTVDAPGDVGIYSSIKVLPSGYPVIAYYDASNGDVKYATSSFAYQTFLPLLKR
jgi:hypothetical protein